jgi:dTDP-4-amino-4,6-dideoxygalactose transaminase
VSRSRNIPFCRVRCDGNELAYVREVLESGWLTTAGKAHALEERFCQAVGSRFALAVNSCTAALHLALEAIGIGPGDHVFVPSMTFTASAEVIRYLGADPIFLDVEYGTGLVTPATLRQALAEHPSVKALVVVHYGGHPAAMLTSGAEGILDLGRRHGLKIVEDAAHAFPTRCGDRMVGSLGDITCFSFYANKTITTGEGGMLTTDDEAIARRVRVMRLHGINRDVWDRFTSPHAGWEYDVIAPGYKYNMPDINAAIGLAQLERAEALRHERQRCAAYYFRRLAGLPEVDLPKLHVPPEHHSWHLFPIILRPQAKLTRNRLIELLTERGIGNSVHYKPLHRMTYYRERYHLQAEDFPVAEQMWQGSVSLPIFPTLREDELEYICATLWELLG